MLLYDDEINKKIKKLPDEVKKEVLDFVDFLSNKYSLLDNNYNKKSNPFRDLAGFVSIDTITSNDIDKEVYNL